MPVLEGLVKELLSKDIQILLEWRLCKFGRHFWDKERTLQPTTNQGKTAEKDILINDI